MRNIKEDLKHIILDVLLPETQTYLEELNKEKENEERETKADIESFIEELQTILDAIENDKISDEDATLVLEKITTMMNTQH